jgi:hypothetical protein
LERSRLVWGWGELGGSNSKRKEETAGSKWMFTISPILIIVVII